MTWKTSFGAFAITAVFAAGTMGFFDNARAEGSAAVPNSNDGAIAAAPYTPPTASELREFDEYMERHPTTARELLPQAGLVEQPKFQQNHPGLMEFLQRHPGLRHQLIGHPYWFIRREHRYQEFKQFDRELTRNDLDQFDGYINRHAQVARELKDNPRLLDDPEYLRKHDELRSFMAAHPELSAQMQRHPDWFVTTMSLPDGTNGPSAPPEGHGN